LTFDLSTIIMLVGFLSTVYALFTSVKANKMKDAGDLAKTQVRLERIEMRIESLCATLSEIGKLNESVKKLEVDVAVLNERLKELSYEHSKNHQ
jgi:predicted nuclease with TOPRIM domain